jgi:uncharacterized protein DUF5753
MTYRIRKSCSNGPCPHRASPPEGRGVGDGDSDLSGGDRAGLLQTYEYSVAVLRAHVPTLPGAEVGLRADRRTQRLSDVGPKVDGSSSLWFTLDEGAFTRTRSTVSTYRALTRERASR